MYRFNRYDFDVVEAQLTAKLKTMIAEVLERASVINGENLTIHMFHAIIGGKNNTYVDSIRMQFPKFDDFYTRWLEGLIAKAKDFEAHKLGKYGRTLDSSSAHRVISFLKDPLIREYTQIFLERNFYRNYIPRTRAKPSDALWSLWFGDNRMNWGIILAPVYRNNAWTNDVSEIRRARYDYWTIGHIMATGLIDPNQVKPLKFTKLEQLLSFYRSVLKRVSNSQYEQTIADCYVGYVEKSRDPYAEPFLIPELRYAGLSAQHRYRLDYAVLNTHTMTFTGYELSPHSTHYSITGIKSKTQVQMNAELEKRWAHEMDKRNNYFKTFGIATVTFTDADLANMDACFTVISQYLAERPLRKVTLQQALNAIDQYPA